MLKLNDKVILSKLGIKAFDRPNEEKIRNSAYGILTHCSDTGMDVTWYDEEHNKIVVTGAVSIWLEEYSAYNIDEIINDLNNLEQKLNGKLVNNISS